MNTHAPGHAVAGDQTVVLGLSGALGHDPSAALYIGPRLVAAAEEERFVRDKHARGRMPLESARFCLRFAGVEPRDVRVVAVPFAPIPLTRAARWTHCSTATAATAATASASSRCCANSGSIPHASSSTRSSITSRTRAAPTT